MPPHPRSLPNCCPSTHPKVPRWCHCPFQLLTSIQDKLLALLCPGEQEAEKASDEYLLYTGRGPVSPPPLLTLYGASRG